MADMRVDLNGRDYMSLCTDYIEKELGKKGIDKKLILKAVLLCEEAIIKLSKYSSGDGYLTVRVKQFLGKSVIELRAEGEEIEELTEGHNISYAAQCLENEEEEVDSGLLILKANEGMVKYSHSKGANLVRIRLQKSEQSSMYITLLALVASIFIGLIFRQFVPETVSSLLCTNIFIPIRTMFTNALKIVVGPVVFFSIVTCVSQFTNLSELGKIGAKVMGMYLFTTLIAVGLGFGFFYLINPGTWGGALTGEINLAEVTVRTDVDTSIIGTLVGIVPNNLLRPFVESDTLQIIFLAILLGVAVGMIGSYSRIIRDLFDACNELFLTVTTMIAKLIPLAVFSSMFILITETGVESMMSMFGMAITVVLALLGMIIIYGILIFVIGRLNPIFFYKKDLPGMLNAFTLASSNATMPMNMQICTDKLGISPKVCNFSIPLGATINMDGVSVHLAVSTLFLAKMYAVTIPESAMMSIIISIVLLSLGAPGVPGSSLVCQGVLLGAIGVPIEAIGLIMGVDSVLDMCRTVSNTTGDMAVTLIVAKLENLLDIRKYKES